MTLPSLPRIDGIALIVEDAMIVAYDVAAMLGDFGAAEVVICATLDDAMRKIAEGLLPTLALLDIDLGGETSLAAARALAERAVPILYSTGYDHEPELLGTFPSGAMLDKPYTGDDIARALVAMGFKAT
ncbi:response regulator [Thioclava atlantica]|nr:response regulator [Thioclava atlantica]